VALVYVSIYLFKHIYIHTYINPNKYTHTLQQYIIWCALRYWSVLVCYHVEKVERLLWHSWGVYDPHILKSLTNWEVICHTIKNLFIALKLYKFFKYMKFLFKVKFAGKECNHSDISSNGKTWGLRVFVVIYCILNVRFRQCWIPWWVCLPEGQSPSNTPALYDLDICQLLQTCKNMISAYP
jgi:hypothetical protein